MTLPLYWIFALVTAAGLVAGLWLLVERTAFGLKIPAATGDPMMAAILAVDIKSLHTVVFALGSTLVAQPPVPVRASTMGRQDPFGLRVVDLPSLRRERERDVVERNDGRPRIDPGRREDDVPRVETGQLGAR